MSDITVIQGLHLINLGFSPSARLYYFEGNFFCPFWSLDGCEVARVKKAMRQFEKENKALVQADRAKPGYKTVLELFDEQVGVN